MIRTNKHKDHDGRKNIVYKYFELISNHDMPSLLDLFEDDATVHEPFSKSPGLHGRSSIEPFLKVAMMANSNMRHKIHISNVEHGQPENQLTAFVTFERGDKTKAKFTFDFDTDDNKKGWKIKTLDIVFLG